MSVALSDYNVRNRVSAVVSKQKPYSDLDMSLDINPSTRDIVPFYDIAAVKNSVKNLILTSFSERPFDPEYGSNLTALLFEPVDKFTRNSLKNAIIRVISVYEPRVDSLVVEVDDQPDNNRYQVTLGFRVITLNHSVVNMDVYLLRIR